jgi:hypothetical protein
MPPADVLASFRRLADAHVIVLAGGSPYIWMANPFSAIPTPFRVTARGRSWWGNCIWDSLGIVAMMGGEGSVTTHCPDCSEPLEVVVSDGSVSHGDYLVHYSVPAARWWDNIGDT